MYSYGYGWQDLFSNDTKNNDTNTKQVLSSKDKERV
jgi:hypothetical protein